MAELRLSAPVQFDSIVDGEGLRAVVWTQGCPHGCPGCHNPQTHAFDGGTSVASESILEQLKAHFYLDGVTFSGGEPMAQAAACGELAQAVHHLGMNVWCYTGYTWEALMEAQDPDQRMFLEQIDVLIDGPFLLAQKSLNLRFRGSANQRLIDVQASLKAQRVVLAEKN
ncbi:anaerobic ribonucleoside-triphosphate reductase activating protein [Holdemania filiformis]|uniref:Anaerobic ribonucleoside-triphosphate reductase-activating protein n=1 Tax=Holdemania filiformis TaxID=61171 RepID=A0A412FJZ1_9FIRM|nr:anaerobic ribonucleoside-triphosphate reductase activating protein [Holdemania filiformis]MBS5001460.1 anaerobic ribonucleoside-triphosphate reductase activating protein [Holdemania filiformis]RGR68473.1 anaerobic ribonucleoside-triphosphate reductase activating protein [Holdemania filiformis]